MIANMRFNGYTREAVLAPAVRRRFDEDNATYSGKIRSAGSDQLFWTRALTCP